MTISKNLTVAFAKIAMDMRGSNPAVWSQFLQVLSARIEEVTEQLVTAPASGVAEHQGRAREIRDVFKALDNGPELARQLQEKERVDAHTRKSGTDRQLPTP
jgi:HPt (histidine-containing phosphotransfer) domain-containing protein